MPQDVKVEAEAPEGSALHVLLAGELVAGWGFPRRRIYAEYRILYDPGIWRLLPRCRPGFQQTTHPRPGVIRVRCHFETFHCIAVNGNSAPSWDFFCCFRLCCPRICCRLLAGTLFCPCTGCHTCVATAAVQLESQSALCAPPGI